jgi:predicted Zn-dependent protease
MLSGLNQPWSEFAKVDQMIPVFSRIFLFIIVCQWLLACASSPTGHTQLKLLPESQMTEMGKTAFNQIKQETPVTDSVAAQNYVQCVAEHLLAELTGQGEWEIQVFEDEAVNAFALPGGKIGVYTGLLKVAENQHQLAAVIGHEIAHVQADHSNARVSANYATSASLQAVQIALGLSGYSDDKGQLLGLLGLGAQYGLLMPYNRSQETEADILGLDLMAKAGFDPRQSINLWQNMAAKAGSQQPEFLSTHPSPRSRIEKLSEEIPEVLPLFNDAQQAGKIPKCHM